VAGKYKSEELVGFQWRDTDPSGAASVQWFHQWVETGDIDIWNRILDPTKTTAAPCACWPMG